MVAACRLSAAINIPTDAARHAANTITIDTAATIQRESTVASSIRASARPATQAAIRHTGRRKRS